MKFPVPKTLTEAIYPTLLINWIFGVGVIEYPIGRPRRMMTGFWSLINFLTYLVFLRVADFSEYRRFHKTTIEENNYRLNSYCAAVFIATTMCLSQIRAKAINAILPKMDIVNDKLAILGIPNDFDLLFKRQIIQLGISFSFMFIMMALDFKYIGLEFPSEFSRLGFLSACHYSLVFGFIVDCSFSGALRYFHNRFQRLNKLLVELDSSGKNKMTETQKLNSEFPRYPSLMNEVYRNNSLAIRAAEELWLLNVIREANNIHRRICKMAMEMNEAFGAQLLFSIALSFGMITTVLYTTYVSTTKYSGDSVLNNWILSLTSMLWIIFYAIKIILIVNACENASYEAKRIGELIIKFLDSPSCDEDVRNQINIFLLELIQNPLTFTANGFFTLDYSLIRGMIGTVITYLIIMIQMRNMYEP